MTLCWPNRVEPADGRTGVAVLPGPPVSGFIKATAISYFQYCFPAGRSSWCRQFCEAARHTTHSVLWALKTQADEGEAHRPRGCGLRWRTRQTWWCSSSLSEMGIKCFLESLCLAVYTFFLAPDGRVTCPVEMALSQPNVLTCTAANVLTSLECVSTWSGR